MITVRAHNKKTGEILTHPDGRPKPLTSHTLSPVPLTLFDPHQLAPKLTAPHDGSKPGLANLAATTLELLGLEPPEDYKPSLLSREG